MASKTSICNAALREIGANAISSVDEDSKEAKLCKQHYDDCVRLMLRQHDWDFSAVWEELAADAGYTIADEGWSYAYQLPSLCLRARKLLDGYDFEERAGRHLLTDTDEAVLCYTQYVSDPTKFPEDFREALVYLLASKLAVPLSKRGAKAEYFLGLYVAALSRATTTDANNSQTSNITAHTDDNDTFLSAR